MINRLNPCCDGCSSLILKGKIHNRQECISLNPCCDGCSSLIISGDEVTLTGPMVLILVVMDVLL